MKQAREQVTKSPKSDNKMTTSIDSESGVQKEAEENCDKKRDRDCIRKEETSGSMNETIEQTVSKKKRKRPIHVEVMIDPACVISLESIESEVEKFIRTTFEPSFMVSFTRHNSSYYILNLLIEKDILLFNIDSIKKEK